MAGRHIHRYSRLRLAQHDLYSAAVAFLGLSNLSDQQLQALDETTVFLELRRLAIPIARSTAYSANTEGSGLEQCMAASLMLRHMLM